MTVLIKYYQNGNIDQIMVLADDFAEEIERYKRLGYTVASTGKPSNYTNQDAWDEYNNGL